MEQHEHVIERYERAWIFFGLAMITVFIILIGYMMLTMGNTNPVGAGRIDATKCAPRGILPTPVWSRLAMSMWLTCRLSHSDTSPWR